MPILALDTTTRGGSVAVLRDDRLLALVQGDATRTHGERNPDEMVRALAQAGVPASSLDLLAVASGPGAFTGLRIGLAAIQGLAMALGLPVAGVPTLDALAWAATQTDHTRAADDTDHERAADDADGADRNLSEPFRTLQNLSEPFGTYSGSAADDTDSPSPCGLIVPWMDGQRGDVFAAVYQRTPHAGPAGVATLEWQPWTVVEQATAGAPVVLLEQWKGRLGGSRALFVGDACGRDRALIEQLGAGQWRARLPGPLAPSVAQIGRRLALAGRAGPPHALAPVYARRPDAELERERRGDS